MREEKQYRESTETDTLYCSSSSTAASVFVGLTQYMVSFALFSICLVVCDCISSSTTVVKERTNKNVSSLFSAFLLTYLTSHHLLSPSFSLSFMILSPSTAVFVIFSSSSPLVLTVFGKNYRTWKLSACLVIRVAEACCFWQTLEVCSVLLPFLCCRLDFGC